MKNYLLTAFVGILLTSSVQALACPHSQEMFICPGDKVVDQSGNIGRASGVNRFKNTISINYGGSADGIENMRTVFLGVGCIDGICVGDKVIDESGNRGRVDAVNPYNSMVAISYGGSADGLERVNTLALGMGCVLGYCVGDEVTDESGNRGVIDGVNRYNQTAAVNYGGSASGISRIRDLSSSVYCATYGDSSRSMKVFPMINTSIYPSPLFHFSAKR